jgi:hypothetical protein
MRSACLERAISEPEFKPGVPADIDRDGLQAGRHNLNNRSFSGYGCDPP